MSRLRAFFEILSTAREAGAVGVRFGPQGSVLLRFGDADTDLDGGSFAIEDLRMLAGFIGGRARALPMRSADGQERRALVYRTDSLGPFEVATELGPLGHTLLLEPLDSGWMNGLSDADRLPQPTELAHR